MPAETKERIVGASAELFRRQGYAGTGVKQIVAEANAPFGSLYHFFPGGKLELGEEVIRSSGGLYLELIDAFYEPEPDPSVATRAFFAAAAETVRETDYADACPVATVALEVASTSEPLRRATAEVFESWLARTAHYFSRAGVPETKSRELAVSAFALLEGAFVLSRATRDVTPIEIAGETAAAAVSAALQPEE